MKSSFEQQYPYFSTMNFKSTEDDILYSRTIDLLYVAKIILDSPTTQKETETCCTQEHAIVGELVKGDVNAASFRGMQPAIYVHGKAFRRSRYQNKTGIWQARS